MQKALSTSPAQGLDFVVRRTDPISCAIRSSRQAMLLTDRSRPDNPIIFANDAFLELTGYSRDEVQGQNCRFLQGRETDPAAIAKIREALSRGEEISIDILNYKKDGTAFWNGLFIAPAPDETGAKRYFFAMQSDISERKAHEFDLLSLERNLEDEIAARTKDLEKELERNTALLHEVDHRVKNDLQMVSAMLLLQSMRSADAGTKSTLREIVDRVEAMSLVHKQLYQSDSVADFNLADCTREIAETLVAGAARDDIALSVEVEPVMIGANRAVPIALVINETIGDALKQAFPAGRAGILGISVKPVSPDLCEIMIRDDGAARPPAAEKASFGRTLLDILILQLKATIEWLPAEPGTAVRITLPIP